MRKDHRTLLGILLFLCVFVLAGSISSEASHTPDPSSVTIAGNLQDELGCSDDWHPDCAATHLGYDSDDDVWQGVFSVPFGIWEYKATLNDAWDENYGAGAEQNGPNIGLSLAADTDVKFYYDHKSHWLTDNVNSVIAVVAGDFQTDLACPGDWQPDCLRSWLQDPDGDGTYVFSTSGIPAGNYEAKVAHRESWDESYGAGGVPGGANIPFTAYESEVVIFEYDPVTHLLTISTASPPALSSVTIAGSLQSELGCPGDWQPDCAATHLGYDPDDDVWQGTFNVPSGDWEYRAALNDSWDENYGANAIPNGPNIGLSLASDADVKFYYDHESHWVTDSQNSVIATVVGDFQTELGCSGDRDPGCLRSWLQDPDGDGMYVFSTSEIPAGDYEVKVAHDESLTENYGAGGVPGGANIEFAVGEGDVITFEYDPVSHVLNITGGIPLVSPSYAVVHYFRADGDYGDHTTGDFNDFWGLHLWGEIDEAIDWFAPKPFLGEDEYGRFAWVELVPGATNVGFIVHRGDVKDGTTLDRFFNPSDNLEIWLRNDDAAVYTSQADAQGFATIHYHRDDGDYGDLTSGDFNDYWGIHLWGDAIAPSEGTDWTAPKVPDGIDDYGAFWNILIIDPAQPLNFIVHRGDQRDTEPDQSFVPLEDASIWLLSGDETIYSQRGAAENFAVLHYHRDDGAYGDPTSGDYNDFWGLHVWTGASNPNPPWPDPIRWESNDTFGIVFKINLVPGAPELAYIIHRGDDKDPGPDQFLVFDSHGYEVWQLQDADPERPYVLPVLLGAVANHTPVVTVDDSIVIVDEGNTALNGGSASDLDGDTLTLSASAGTIVDNLDGTWSWSFTTTDGPMDSQIVTITADDGNTGIGQSTFDLVVSNVAPTVDAGPDHEVISGDVVSKEISFSDAGTSDAPWVYTIDWEDGTIDVGATTDQSLPIVASHQYFLPGEYNVEVCLTDKDGDAGCDYQVVTVRRLQVKIDIKPGSDPNSVNPRSRGNVPVAVLGSEVLEVSQVNPESVRFAGAGIVIKRNGQFQYSLEDVNGDGYMDFIAHFKVQDMEIRCGDTSSSIAGNTYNGIALEGSDTLNIVGCQ